MTKLRRAKEGKKLAGVCKGIANAFDVDVTYVRLVFVGLAILPPITILGMLIIYGVLAYILPEEEEFFDV